MPSNFDASFEKYFDFDRASGPSIPRRAPFEQYGYSSNTDPQLDNSACAETTDKPEWMSRDVDHYGTLDDPQVWNDSSNGIQAPDSTFAHVEMGATVLSLGPIDYEALQQTDSEIDATVTASTADQGALSFREVTTNQSTLPCEANRSE